MTTQSLNTSQIVVSYPELKMEESEIFAEYGWKLLFFNEVDIVYNILQIVKLLKGLEK